MKKNILTKFISNPYIFFEFLSKKKLLNWMNDKTFLSLIFRARMGRKLDFNNLKTYNEKLQWLKLNDRNPLYTKLVDKYEVKKYVSQVIGEKYLIKTLGIYNSFDEINFDELPNSFVIKCTHDSGGLVLCKDKNNLNLKKARIKIEKSLKNNYYKVAREWPYKDIIPKIIIEEYLGETNTIPEDYKFFVFNNEIDSVMVCTDRESGKTNFYFYDENWDRLIYQRPELENDDDISVPKKFDEMKNIVKKLSKEFKQIRVDLYNIDGQIYFGELTLFNHGGFDTDITYDTDLKWGSKIQI